MPRTVVPTTTVARAGVSQPSAVFADISNNHYVANNNGRMWIEMANISNSSTVNVTFDVPAVYDGDLTIVDIIVALAPGGGTKLAGPWKIGVFNNISNAVNFDVGSTGVSFRGYALSS